MLRPVVLALTVLTGFTGLAYEVAWQKYLGVLLGAHSEATAAVLGLFLGGLSIGYWLFGSLTRRRVERGQRRGQPARLLLLYGTVEASIGAYCVLFPTIFPAVRWLSVWLPTGGGALSFAVDVCIAAVLILPPAVLMGGTIPILTQALSRSLADATRFHALVYAFNTAGAFLGALGAGFILIRWLGLDGVLYAMGTINLVVGAVFVLLGRRRREVVVLEQESAALPSGAALVYGMVALLVGFSMMVFQTIVIRIAGLSFGSSEYTFSMVVAVFVLCIALGSFAVSALSGIVRHLLPASLWVLTGLCGGLYFLLETGPYWAHLLRALIRDVDQAFYFFYAAQFVGLLCLLGPAVALSGATLPLLFHALRREVKALGSQAGRLYSLNTVGSLLGALLGGYALLFWLDLHHVYRLAVAALALAATIATLRQYPRIGFVGASVVLVVALVTIATLPAWRTSHLMAGTFRTREPVRGTFMGPSVLGSGNRVFSFYDDDPNVSVAVQDGFGEAGIERAVIVNGKSDGHSRGDYPTMALAALVPALFAERAEHSFVIGFGTGVTAGELAELSEAKRVEVAEISAGVIAAAPLFDFVNHGASKHPKVTMTRSDAYRALLRAQRQYDVIVSEPSNPWVTGVEMLFSTEFLSEARDRLTPGGVYCQWYHTYETSSEALELVLRTYASVFDHVAVWSVNRFDLLLLGFRDADAALDLARFETRMGRRDFRAGLARAGVRDLEALLAHETLPLDVVGAAGLEGPLHSLYHPRLSYVAGRAFFVGGRGRLPFLGYGESARIGAENSLLRRHLKGFGGEVPEAARERIVSEACRLELAGCGPHLASWGVAEPESGAFREAAGAMRSKISPRVLRDLARLLERPDGEAATSAPGADGIAPGAAVRMARLYLNYYAHSLPFEPAALVDVWERCEGSAKDADGCRRGLEIARGLAAGQPPPDARRWLRPLPEMELSKAASQR